MRVSFRRYGRLLRRRRDCGRPVAACAPPVVGPGVGVLLDARYRFLLVEDDGDESEDAEGAEEGDKLDRAATREFKRYCPRVRLVREEQRGGRLDLVRYR
jgi:hypothetical protein